MARHRPMHVYVTNEQYMYLRWAKARTGLAMAELIRGAIVQAYGPHFELAGEDMFEEDMSGNGDGMDTKRVTEAAFVGTRGKLGARAADEVAKRTRVSAETLRMIAGSYLIVSRIRSLVKMVRRYRASG